MYMDQARRDVKRRDEERAQAARRRGGDEGGGWTLFGVHLTAGVVGAFVTLVAGLAGMAFIAAFRDEMRISPRMFVGAIACTTIGALSLLKLVFFGGEED